MHSLCLSVSHAVSDLCISSTFLRKQSTPPMARPSRDAIEAFVRVTGASESLALRKLEENGGNLDQALNAHFGEAERYPSNQTSVASPQHDFANPSNQVQARPRGLLPLLSAARSFRPSLLLDRNYRRDLLNQIAASVSTSSAGGFNSGYDMPHYMPIRPVIGEDASPTSFYSSPQSHGNVSTYSDSLLHGNDMEERMIQIAIEASKQEGSSGIRLPQRQPHLEDEELTHALSLSLKTAELEEALREQTLGSQKNLGIHDSSEIAGKTGNDKLKPEDRLLNEGAEDLQEQELWSGMSSKELDEALLLEAAMFGEIPSGVTSLQRAPHLQSTPDKNPGIGEQDVPRPPPSSLVALRSLRQQQDDEYLASLLADREKEASAFRQAESSHARDEESQNKKASERLLAAKAASLPPEPAAEDENAITLLIRMPNGSRCGRRFLKSDKLKFLFDFIDVGRAVKAGTYRVVRPYPRHPFCIGESSASLNELGLTNKQETLFLELI